MHHVQHRPAGTPAVSPARSARTAPEPNATIVKTDSEGDRALKADSAGRAVARRAGTIASGKLAKVFMQSENMELGSQTRSLMSDCQISWMRGTLVSHNGVVPKMAESILTVAKGDVTKAFAFAAATGDSCVASALFEAGADTAQAAKDFIDRGQWDAVKLIIQHRLVQSPEWEEGILDVVAYALQSTHGPSMEWLQWLCAEVRGAGQRVAAHFGHEQNLAALMALARSQSIGADYLIDAVLNMPGLTREQRISAIQEIIGREKIPRYVAVARASEDALHDQLARGNLQAAELMIASGVRWGHALLYASVRGDVPTVKNLLKCDGVGVNAVMNDMLSRTFPGGRAAMAAAMIEYYALERPSSSPLKVLTLKWLLNAPKEIRGVFRDVADAMLRDETWARNTEVVAIFKAAGVKVYGNNDLDELADVRTWGVQQPSDARRNAGNEVNPVKPFV